MKIIKLLILLGAGYFGYIYYQRYYAISNLTSSGDSYNSSYSAGSSLGAGGSGGIGEVGGVGNIGEGRSLFKKSGTRSTATKTAPYAATLLKAAAKGDIQEVASLMEKKLPPDVRDDMRRTPLMHAAWRGHKDVCAKLLAAGANIAFKDRDGFDALDYAAGHGQYETVKFLLAATAKEDTAHYQDFARLMASVLGNHLPSLPKNEPLAYINRITPEKQSSIHVAAGNGYMPMARKLVALGADIRLQNGDKQTPLHWAAWNGHTDMVRYLLENGARINARDIAGNTPLIMASTGNRADVVKTLLAAGAKKNVTNEKGQTALMIAADKGYQKLLPLLQ